MKKRDQIPHSRRWVIKIGSALLTADGQGLDRAAFAHWVQQMAAWLKSDEQRELVLISSGAVAEGLCRLGWQQRPHALYQLQAAAAVGQMGLVQAWESSFQAHDLHTAQVLLTHDDLSNRCRYLNARSTLRTLLDLKVIPVVNENDVVANDEIRLGDNDTLAALVANLIEAELLILLTDQQGLFNADPRHDPQARLIEEAAVEDPQLNQYAGESKGRLGSGGMMTKLRAARIAARSGTATLIASGREPHVLERIAQGKNIGTFLIPQQEPQTARKRWLSGQLQLKGQLILDAGAVQKIKYAGSSLLAVGVKAVKGQFQRGEVVACLDESGQEIARGLINYSADETRKLCGQPSHRFEEILGYIDEEELIHRDNLVIL